MIGIVLCNLAGSFGVSMLVAIEEEAERCGYLIAFKNSKDDLKTEKEAIDELLSLGVVGLIVQPIHNMYYNEKIIQLHLNGFPLVLLDRHHFGFVIPTVSTNNKLATAEMTKYLFLKGHENIVFVSIDSKYSTSIADRFNGFRSAFLELEKLFTKSNILMDLKSPLGKSGDEEKENDIRLIVDFMETNPQITCFFACEFSIAQLICSAIQRLNKKVPQDYSLAMFDFGDNIFGMVPCHIAQNQTQMGKTAVVVLHDIINGKKITEEEIYIPYNFINGDTVVSLCNDKNMSLPKNLPYFVDKQA